MCSRFTANITTIQERAIQIIADMKTKNTSPFPPWLIQYYWNIRVANKASAVMQNYQIGHYDLKSSMHLENFGNIHAQIVGR
jgi:hypothetical protein